MSHNIINDKRIIKLDPRYQFAFIEYEELEFQFPTSDYFYTLHDLSINLNISLKWILWAHFFFDSISRELRSDYYNWGWEEIIKVGAPILPEKPHTLLIDDEKITDVNDIYIMLEKIYLKKIFHENTKIEVKLNLNLREYLIITNLIRPVLMITETIYLKK